MWDLSSLTRDRNCVPCIGRRIPYQWTTREVPGISGFFNFLKHVQRLKILSRVLKSSKAVSETSLCWSSRSGRIYDSHRWLNHLCSWWLGVFPFHQIEAEELACIELGNHNSSIGGTMIMEIKFSKLSRSKKKINANK